MLVRSHVSELSGITSSGHQINRNAAELSQIALKDEDIDRVDIQQCTREMPSSAN